MKKLKIPGLFFLLLSIFICGNKVNAGIFDDDEKNWERVFVELKKINSRLVTLETIKFKSIQQFQENLLQQIKEIQGLLPQLQGGIEQSRAEFFNYIKKTNSKLLDLEGHLKNEITAEFAQQRSHNQQLKSDLDSQFSQLTDELAKDLEKLAKSNNKSFLAISNKNTGSLQTIVQGLNQQNQALENYNSIIKSELVPTIAENRRTLLSEVARANQNSNLILKENNESIKAGFSEIDLKNQKLIEILGKSFAEEQVTKGQVELIGQNLKITNQNIKLNNDQVVKLKEILDGRLDNISKEQIAFQAKIKGDRQSVQESIVQGNRETADGLQALQTQNTDLLNSSKAIATHSAQLEEKLDQTVAKLEDTQSNIDIANQKLAKLIEILKTIALEQSKVGDVMKSQQEIEAIQKEVKNALNEVKGSQGEIKEALGDLKRKANVNISRNDDIKKALKKIRTRGSSKPAKGK